MTTAAARRTIRVTCFVDRATRFMDGRTFKGWELMLSCGHTIQYPHAKPMPADYDCQMCEDFAIAALLDRDDIMRPTI